MIAKLGSRRWHRRLLAGWQYRPTDDLWRPLEALCYLVLQHFCFRRECCLQDAIGANAAAVSAADGLHYAHQDRSVSPKTGNRSMPIPVGPAISKSSPAKQHEFAEELTECQDGRYLAVDNLVRLQEMLSEAGYDGIEVRNRGLSSDDEMVVFPGALDKLVELV